MNTTWIRVAYGVMLALVLLLTVNFGVALALNAPKPPADPDISFRQLTSGGDEESSQNRLTAAIDKFYDDAQDYRDKYVDYQRNAFLAGAGIAALLAMIGLLLPASVNYLRWGLLLGAVLTLIWAGYTATRSVPNPAPAANSVLALVAAGEPKQLDFAGRFLRFAVSFVSLILLLFIGLWRLTEWPSTARRTAAVPQAAAPTPAPSAWAPSPSAPAAAPVATESATVVPESPPRATSAPSAAATQWGRPAETNNPAGPAPTRSEAAETYQPRPAEHTEPLRRPDAPV